jgi:cyclomaltodextrinase / maltogenic alpha-amylase / neopullulanase
MRFPDQIETIPEWARRAVFYHIYPFGFFNAPQSNSGRSASVPRLASLRNYYDHLQGLGITALYIGPLFESLTHGYDTSDYFTIDRRLGDVNLFRQIVDELHERGIRVILDGVFHHTGRGFFAFRDLLENRRESRYKDWYLINWGADSGYNDGFSYDCWEGHESLPRLNLDHPEVREYLFQVTRMWLGDVGIDGWRLDVAHKISPSFWWEFRRISKETRPDCFLVGELLGGDYRTWVAPDLLDSGTDYQLYKAMWSSFNDKNFWELKAVLERSKHPEWGVFRDLHLMTFLGNHDVNRIASQLTNARNLYPALILLLTLPGVPCLYYGDEVGMTGKVNGPDGDHPVRQAMPAPDDAWPNADRSLYLETSRLVNLRKTHPSLIYGRFAVLETGYEVFSFLREHPREVTVTAVNAGDEPTRIEIAIGREGIPDGTTFRDLLDDAQPEFVVSGGKLVIKTVYPGWGRVLVAAR